MANANGEKKSLDVEEPLLVDASPFANLVALIAMESLPFKGVTAESAFIQLYSDDQCGQNLQTSHDTPGSSPENEAQPKAVDHFHYGGIIPKSNKIRKSNPIITLRTGQSLTCGLGPAERLRPHMHDDSETEAITLDLNHRDVRRWELRAKALKELGTLPDRKNKSPELNWKGTRYDACEISLVPGTPSLFS
jgi:hypothetical protein